MPVNGVLSNSISANDRGLLYGDGVFRTMRLSQGKIQHWPRHYQKLQQDCAAMLLDCPGSNMLTAELGQLVSGHENGVVKIIITRGQGGRGYALPANQASSRILSLMPPPDSPEYFRTKGIKVHVCNMRLAHQPRLAGIKHLNRLENVLAAAEWNNADVAEGILLDIEGNVIEGTRSNLFMISNGELITPDLSRCGVAGIQRERVMEWAAIHSMSCKVEQLSLAKLLEADELFFVNSVIGLWPVHEMLSRIWANSPVAKQIQKWLELEVA
jgi:4-amino-4-deoxychorismate lyase